MFLFPTLQPYQASLDLRIGFGYLHWPAYDGEDRSGVLPMKGNDAFMYEGSNNTQENNIHLKKTCSISILDIESV